MEYGSYNCRRTGHSRCITRKEADARVEYLNLKCRCRRYRCLDTDVVNLVGRIYDNNRKFDQQKLDEISIAFDDLWMVKIEIFSSRLP
jgi:hypothetical protein